MRRMHLHVYVVNVSWRGRAAAGRSWTELFGALEDLAPVEQLDDWEQVRATVQQCSSQGSMLVEVVLQLRHTDLRKLKALPYQITRAGNW